MAAQVMVQSHYLPVDAAEFIGAQCLRHPALASLAVLLSFGAAVVILRRHFGRGGADIFAVALFFLAVILLGAACLYLLVTRPGYRVFHPGF